MINCNGTLHIQNSKCPPSCTSCIDACQKAHGDSAQPVIEKIDLPEVGFSSILTCNQCSNADCLNACPTGAIALSDQGAVTINADLCIGCYICNLVCPYGGIATDTQQHKSLKCDTCQSQPQCSAACPNHTIAWKDANPIFDNMEKDQLSPGLPYCAGCAMELLDRFVLRLLGTDIVVFGAPSCNVLSSKMTLPYYGTLMTQAASSATGVSRYFQHIKKDTLCVAIIGDGATADLGFGQLSAAAERGERILYICYDNEAYMNTGIQRSGTTPLWSWTNTTQIGPEGRGKQCVPKNVPMLMAFHGIQYTATATLSHLDDFMRKLLKAKEAAKEGMAYLHVLTPCPTGWKYKSEDAIEICRSAVETNYFPLWEAENGEFTLNYEPKPQAPITEFIRLMKRFSHLSPEEVGQFQAYVNHSFNSLQKMIRCI